MPTRAQSKRLAEAAAAPGEPVLAEPPKRRTTPRNRKGKKAEETPPPPTPEPAPATKETVSAMLLPRLQEANPTVTEDDLRGLLDAAIDSYEVQDFEAMTVLEDIQEDILSRAQAMLAPDEEEAPPEEPGSAAAAAQAASVPPTPAAAPEPVDGLLAAAKAAQAKRAAAAVPPSPSSEGEEDSPAAKSPQEVMSIRVPITGQAIQYTLDVKASSPGAVPMEASQASASQGTVDEEAAPAPGVVDATTHTVRWYPVTEAAFPEKLGERMNLIFPAHKMAPVAWSEMKESHRTSGETYFAFTVSETPPGSDFGNDYTLATGDPKKVVAAGVVNTHRHSPSAGAPPVLTVVLLDMGTRDDVQPKGVNPYLSLALKSLATQMRQFGPNVLVRYSRKQLFKDPEYLSTRDTLFSLGIPLSSRTRGGPEGQEALFKVRTETDLVAIERVKLALAQEGADRVVYTYREERTGAEKTFPGSAIDRLYVLKRTGTEMAPTVEFVGYLGSVLTPIGEGETDVTIPDPILQDGYKRVEPRRGGRRRTYRKRATSRRSSSPKRTGPSSGRRSEYTRRRRA